MADQQSAVFVFTAQEEGILRLLFPRKYMYDPRKYFIPTSSTSFLRTNVLIPNLIRHSAPTPFSSFQDLKKNNAPAGPPLRCHAPCATPRTPRANFLFLYSWGGG